MLRLSKGRFVARLADGPADIAAAQALRYRAFRAPANGAEAEDVARTDADRFDPDCSHMLVFDRGEGAVVCCFRLFTLTQAPEIVESYSAQFYDLAALASYPGKMAEIGRFCIDPQRANDPDILRVAWGAMTQFVDRAGIDFLFGCSSFAGTDAGKYAEAFAELSCQHLAPERWKPGEKAPHVIRFGEIASDPRVPSRGMPPLLRTYLMMGGWVGDHAVVDHDLNTLHVFTGLEISAIPPMRTRLLRSLAS